MQLRRTAPHIINLAVPAILGQLSLTMVQLVDTMFIGRLGPLQLSAAALVGLLFWNIQNIGEGFSVGLTACIARMIGSRKTKEAVVFAKTGQIGLAVLGTAFIPVLYSIMTPLFRVIAMPEELFTFGASYLNSLIPFIPFVFLLTAVQAAYRASGNTKTPMVVGFAMNGLNIFLDWVLIFGNLGFPALGMGGAALASGISFAGGWLALYLLSGKYSWGSRGKAAAFSFSHLLRIIRLGVPATIERMAMSVSQLMVIAISVNPLGSYYIAASHIVIRMASISFMPGFGFAIAASTLSGQKLGAGKPDEAARYIWHTVIFCSFVMAGISILFFSVPEGLSRLFTNDPTLLALTPVPLRIYASFAVFLAPTMVLSGGLRGAGDTTFTMITMFCTRFIIRLPLSWVLSISFGFGLTGVWIAMCSDFVIRALILSVRMKQGKWKDIKI